MKTKINKLKCPKRIHRIICGRCGHIGYTEHSPSGGYYAPATHCSICGYVGGLVGPGPDFKT
jgi:hypothetical protein